MGYRAILVANLIHFEPSRLMFYIVYFAMGITPARGDGSTECAAWGPEGMDCAVRRSSRGILVHDPLRSLRVPAWAKLLVSMFRSALCIAVFGALMTAGFAHWNRPDPVDGFLARKAYTVYIITTLSTRRWRWP